MERMIPRPDITNPYSLRSHLMLESLGTEIRSSVKSGYNCSFVTFQLYRPAGIRGRRAVGEWELHTARVLVTVGVACLVLHTHSGDTEDTQDRLMGDLGGKYCCTDWPRCTTLQSILSLSYPPGEL